MATWLSSVRLHLLRWLQDLRSILSLKVLLAVLILAIWLVIRFVLMEFIRQTHRSVKRESGSGGALRFLFPTSKPQSSMVLRLCKKWRLRFAQQPKKTKLADGNCWMTQNLELDLSTNTPLTSELSDVTSSWTPANSTYTSAQDGTNNNTPVQSWNLGKVVWKTPDSSNYCGGSSGDYDFATAGCDSYWQDVSNWTPMTQHRTDGITYDASSQTYDAHYLAGNYYSWEAATAGTGHSYTSSGSQAPDSICPKGFELPLSHTDNNNVSGSFYNLLNQYGFTSSTGSGTNSITRAPLFFVRSGYVYPTYYLGNAGYGGYYWSSVADSSSSAYVLTFYSSRVNPSNDGSRYYGHSVRCVALSN